MIEALRQATPELNFTVSTTTQTGFDRGRQIYGEPPDVRLIRYPLDFTGAIRRALDAVRPDVVVLMELEIWPNFVLQCHKRHIPVMIANGRITEPSFKKYTVAQADHRAMLRRIFRVCVQDETYAGRFTRMGADPKTVQITGTMKFDTAQIGDRVEGDDALAAAMGLQPGTEPIFVCGSTGPGEEEIPSRGISLAARRIRSPAPGDHPAASGAV